MGVLASCCRRRKPQAGSEREPLLPKDRVRQTVEDTAPSQAQINKLAEVLAACKAGKSPSEGQIEHALHYLLDSEVLEESRAWRQYGRLSRVGEKVVRDVKEVLEATLEFGREKNGDNTLQRIFHQYTQASSENIAVRADIAVDAHEDGNIDVAGIADALPSKEEVTDDSATLLRSIRTLAQTLIMSSAFRTLLTELVSLARDTVGDAAVKVERVAELVEGAAQTIGDVAINVESTARPDMCSIAPLPPLSGGSTARSPPPDLHGAEDGDPSTPMKNAIVHRLQDAVRHAQEDPSSHKALVTILSILRKYVTRLSATGDAVEGAAVPSFTPVIWAEKPLANILSGLKVFLSRMASGHPLDPLVQLLYVCARDLVNLPAEAVPNSHFQREMRELVEDLGAWFDSSLSDRHYVISAESKEELDDLYDRARNLIDEASRLDLDWLRHIRALLSEIDAVKAAFASDEATGRLLHAISALTASLSRTTRMAVSTAPGKLQESQRNFRADLQQDILQWLVPRVLLALRAVPMPRVEYSSSGKGLDVAVDTSYLTPTSAQASLIPDHIYMCNYSEVRLDVLEMESQPHQDPIVPSYASGGMQTSTRFRIYVDGVRLSARDVGYYVAWQPFSSSLLRWLGYEDEGLVSVDIGARGMHGDGLSFEFELEYYSDSLDLDADGAEVPMLDTLFAVNSVHVSSRGLSLSLDRSKHWLLNKLVLQPLSGPIGQLVVGWVLKRQLQGLLETCGRMALRASREAGEMAEDAERDVEWTDYTSAIWRVLADGADTAGMQSEDADDADEEDSVLIEAQSSTRTTAKGIIHATTTYAEGSSPPVDESVLAVGIGAQILPGKGGPHGEAQDNYGPSDLLQEGVDEIQSRTQQASEAGHEALRQVNGLRHEVERAEARERDSEARERRIGGWRSRAFDF